jgi:hypothetical protein
VSRSLSLAGVAVGAAGFAAALTGVYEAMRELMVDNGGYCASGGPYEVAAGHSCDGRTWVLIAGPWAGIAFAALLVGASNAWSDDRISGVGALLWGGTFAALGWNFLDLGIDPPGSTSGSGAWILCGVLFWAMALGGLVYAGYGLRDYFRPAGSEPTPPVPLVPLVRAIVNQPATSTPGLSPAGAPAAVPERSGSSWVWLATTVAAGAAGALAVVAVW